MEALPRALHYEARDLGSGQRHVAVRRTGCEDRSTEITLQGTGFRFLGIGPILHHYASASRDFEACEGRTGFAQAPWDFQVTGFPSHGQKTAKTLI